MSNLKTPQRYTYVGSFLRPEKLKEARKNYEDGKIDYNSLKSVEDECITNLIKKLKELGYHIITDGEFRRATWHFDFMWGFEGVGHQKTKSGQPFHDEVAYIDDTYITGKLKLTKTHPFVEHFKFVKKFEDEKTIAKQTIPSPCQFYYTFTTPGNRKATEKFYSKDSEFAEDLINCYKTFIIQLYDAGCRNLQFDDCTWTRMADDVNYKLFGVEKEGLKEVQKLYSDLINKVIANAPKDLTINIHVCRGNYHSTYFSKGPYDSVADELFGKENVNAYYLEYDDERSGGFEPLAKVSGDKKVVLGLITSKKPELENKETVIKRIKEASKYVPLERLHLSPQCGFASCEIGNKLTEEEQWNKLKLVKEIAEEVWK